MSYVCGDAQLTTVLLYHTVPCTKMGHYCSPEHDCIISLVRHTYYRWHNNFSNRTSTVKHTAECTTIPTHPQERPAVAQAGSKPGNGAYVIFCSLCEKSSQFQSLKWFECCQIRCCPGVLLKNFTIRRKIDF